MKTNQGLWILYLPFKFKCILVRSDHWTKCTVQVRHGARNKYLIVLPTIFGLGFLALFQLFGIVITLEILILKIETGSHNYTLRAESPSIFIDKSGLLSPLLATSTSVNNCYLFNTFFSTSNSTVVFVSFSSVFNYCYCHSNSVKSVSFSNNELNSGLF